MKIAYFGFDLFADCLDYIVSNGYNVVKIFTCEVDGVYETNSRVFEIAERYGIEITDSKVTRNDIEKLESLGCDIIISAGYYFKIPISKKIMGVNIHPALLPVGKGPWPQPVTILKGLDESGITLHKLAEKIDCGDIIFQHKIAVSKTDNLETLTKKMQEYAPLLLEKFLSNPENYFGKSVKQANGEYWNEPNVCDMTFSLEDDYSKIDRITRAFYGYKCYLNNRKIIKAVCVKSGEEYMYNYTEKFDIDGGKLLVLK